MSGIPVRAAVALILLLAVLPLQAQTAPPVAAAPPIRPIVQESTFAPPVRDTRSRWVEGALAGFVIGGAATWFLLHTGDSNSLCDRDRNQDAIRSGECLALAAGGGVVGALIGGLVGSRIRTSLRQTPIDELHIGYTPRAGMNVTLRLDPANPLR